MTRRSRTGGKTSGAKARNVSPARARKTTKAKPGNDLEAIRARLCSASDPSNDLKEARAQQAATAEILKVIASSMSDVQPVFEAIASSANRLIDGFSTAVFRFVDDMVHVVAFTPTTPEADVAFQAMFPNPRSQVPALALVENGETAQIADSETSDPQSARIARARGWRSVLFAPLMNKDVPIGFISVTRRETGSFADHHVQLLQTFANQAVIAIENARLFNETQEALERQTATANVLKVISRSAFDLEIVLNTLIESAVKLGGSRRGAITFCDNGVLRLKSHFGFTDEHVAHLHENPVKISMETMTGRPALLGHTVHIPDVLADPDFKNYPALAVGKFRAFLGVPLKRDGVVFGVLGMNRPEPGPFTQRQIELVETFADQAVIAIENVRLFDEVKAKTRDLSEALTYQTGSANILRVIASSPTDVEPALQAIVESSCELCQAYDAAVVLQDGGDLRFSAHHGPIPIGIEKWPINRRWVSGRAFVDQIAVHIHDLSDEAHTDLSDGRELALRMGHRTILAVPLLREGSSIGAIVLRRTEVHPFTEKQIALLKTFADQAVIAIGNVRLFEEVQERTRELTESLQQQTATSEVLKVISSSPGELEPVFRSMLENAVSICDAKFGNLFLIDGDSARWEAGVRTPPKMVEYFTQSESFRPTPGSHLERVMRTKQASHTADDTAEPVIGVAARLGGSRSSVCVPMVKDDALVGAIFIYRTEVRPFTEKQIDLVKNFAAQAVIAIENTRLLNELRQRTDALTASLENLRTAQDRLVQTEKLASLGQLTAGIAHEIKNPLNFVNNFSSLSAELIGEVNDVLKDITLDPKPRHELEELTAMLKSNLEKVVQHGQRADSIVKNMLLHSREGSGEQRSTDINALVDESLNLAYHGARAERSSGFNVTLQRDFDASAGSAELYPQEITRALLNLLSNGFYAATKRKNDNGQTEFEPTLLATTKSLGSSVEIRIRDNGMGIPPEVKAKMFNPFFTTKPAGEGTGLGLSMTHDIIVKQHGGRIDVATEVGHFTEFTIVLPRSGPKQ